MDSKIVEFDCLKNCRVCLISESEMFSLCSPENKSYKTMLMECANVNVDKEDGLPVVICNSCFNEMLEAHKFVTKCQETDRNLRNLLQSKVEFKDVKGSVGKEYSVPILDMVVKKEPDNFEEFNQHDKYKHEEEHEENDECEESNNMSEDDVESNKKNNKKKRNIKKKRGIKQNNKDNKVKRNAHKKSVGYPRKCTDCELILKFESHMKIHMRTHTNEKPYQCADCGECFKSKRTLGTHNLKLHATEEQRNNRRKDFACNICNRTFFRRRDMLIHNRTHTGETPYQCKFCPKAFAQISSLIRHTRIHTGERPYECPHCQKPFASSSEVTVHQRVHSNEKNHACLVCNALFKSKDALKAHGVVHTNLKEFVCEICAMSFNEKGNLKKHIDRMHSDRAGQCCVCNKKFSKLDDHMRTHTGETPFECDLCSKKFSTKARLRLHITYHKTSDKYPCQVEGCSKKFYQKAMLVFHILKYHKKLTPYMCKHCTRGFYRLSDLKKHLRVSHSNEPNVLEYIKSVDLIYKNISEEDFLA